MIGEKEVDSQKFTTDTRMPVKRGGKGLDMPKPDEKRPMAA